LTTEKTGILEAPESRSFKDEFEELKIQLEESEEVSKFEGKKHKLKFVAHYKRVPD